MRKFIVVLTVMMLLMGCSKEQSANNDSLVNSRWVQSTSDARTYCLEFISDLEVKMYICDHDYNYISDDQICTYVRRENQLEFNPRMAIATSAGFAYFDRAIINGNTMRVYRDPTSLGQTSGAAFSQTSVFEYVVIVMPSYTGIFYRVK